VSEISSLQSPSTPHISGVETSNSARSQMNSCGDASKSNGWRSQETYRVPRAEWWSFEWCYFRKVGFCFQCVKLLNGLNWNWKNLNSFKYTLCSYVLKLNKWKHLLFMTFLKSPNSLTHPALYQKYDNIIHKEIPDKAKIL
jgi:hypothetical protein